MFCVKNNYSLRMLNVLSAEDSDRVFQMAYDTSTGSLHPTNETGRDEFRVSQTK